MLQMLENFLTILEFLESAELAYLGCGIDIQKVNRLYNKHLSDEIKSHLINISDNYVQLDEDLVDC